ncbi:hypothetical protein HDU87_007352 [Geranomyces variabilis]|uniref:FHA domain-containing protein n=1 Tax=Geranomyces variabilis TaxID=109894 RepID=A0AAD5XMR7_9FUNG|nr:hypothetical protein HDU87_007352 [Geranomyces variabilis]
MADAAAASAAAAPPSAPAQRPATTTAERLNLLIDQFAQEAQALVVTYQKLLAHTASPAALNKQWTAVELVATSLETTMAPKPTTSTSSSPSTSILRPHVLKLGAVVARALDNYQPPQPNAAKKPAKPDQEMMKSVMGLLTAVKDAVSVYVDAPEDASHHPGVQKEAASAVKRNDAMPPSRADSTAEGGSLLPPPSTHPAAPPRSSSQQQLHQQEQQRQALESVAASLDANRPLPAATGSAYGSAADIATAAPPIPPLFTKPVRSQQRGSKSEEGQAAPPLPLVSLQTALASAPLPQQLPIPPLAAPPPALAQDAPVVAPLSDEGHFLNEGHEHSALTAAAKRLSKRLSARIDRAMDAIRGDETKHSAGAEELEELPEWRADQTGNPEFDSALADAAIAASHLDAEIMYSLDDLGDDAFVTELPEWQADATGNAEFDNAFTSAVLAAARVLDDAPLHQPEADNSGRELSTISSSSLDQLPEWQADQTGNAEFDAAFAQAAIVAADLSDDVDADLVDKTLDAIPEWRADATGCDEFDAAFAQAAVAASEIPYIDAEAADVDSQSEIPEWRVDATGADEFDAAYAQAAVTASELPNLNIDYGRDAVSLESLNDFPDWTADATGADEFDDAFAQAAVAASNLPDEQNLVDASAFDSTQSLEELPEWNGETGAPEFDAAFAEAAITASNRPEAPVSDEAEPIILAVDTGRPRAEVHLVTRPAADIVVPLSAVNAAPPAIPAPATVVVSRSGGRPQPAPQPSTRARAELFKAQPAPAPSPVRKQPIEIPRASQPLKPTAAAAATTAPSTSTTPAMASNPALLRAQKQANRRSLLHVPSVRQATAFFEQTIEKVTESANSLKRRPASPHGQQPRSGFAALGAGGQASRLGEEEETESSNEELEHGDVANQSAGALSSLPTDLTATLGSLDQLREEDGSGEDGNDDEEEDDGSASEEDDYHNDQAVWSSQSPTDTTPRTANVRDEEEGDTTTHAPPYSKPAAATTTAHSEKQPLNATVARSPQANTPSTAVDRDNEDVESPRSLARHPSLRDVLQIAKEIIGDLGHQQQQHHPSASQQEPTMVMRLAVAPQGGVTPAAGSTATIKLVTRDNTRPAAEEQRAPSPHRDLGDSGEVSDASDVDERDESPDEAVETRGSSQQVEAAGDNNDQQRTTVRVSVQPQSKTTGHARVSTRASTLPTRRDEEQQTSARASAVIAAVPATRDEAQQTSARASTASISIRDELQAGDDYQPLSRISRALGVPASRDGAQRQSAWPSSLLPTQGVNYDAVTQRNTARTSDLLAGREQQQTIRVSVPPPAPEASQQTPSLSVHVEDQQQADTSTHRASVRQSQAEQHYPAPRDDGARLELRKSQLQATDAVIAANRQSQLGQENVQSTSSARQSRLPLSASHAEPARLSVVPPVAAKSLQKEGLPSQEGAETQAARLSRQPLESNVCQSPDVQLPEHTVSEELSASDADVLQRQDTLPGASETSATRPKDPRLLHLTRDSPALSSSSATLPDSDESVSARTTAATPNASSPVPLSESSTLGASTTSTAPPPSITTTTAPAQPIVLRPLKITLTPQNGQFTGFTVTLHSTLRLGRGTPRDGFRGFQSQVVSRNHCDFLLARDGSGKVFVRDCGSNSGTFLNGERLSVVGVESEPVEVKSGDWVQLGKDYEGSGGANVPEARRKCVKMIFKIEPMELPAGFSTPELDAKVSSASLGGTSTGQPSVPDLRGEYSASAESLSKSNLSAGDISGRAGGGMSLDAVNIIGPDAFERPKSPTIPLPPLPTQTKPGAAWPSTRPASKPQGWVDPGTAAAVVAGATVSQPAPVARTRYTIAVSGSKEKARKVHVTAADGSEGLTIGLKFWDTKRVVMIQDQRPQYASQNPGFEIFPDPRVTIDTITTSNTDGSGPMQTPFVVTTATGAGMGKLQYISPLKLYIESAPALTSQTPAAPSPAGLRAGPPSTPPSSAPQSTSASSLTIPGTTAADSTVASTPTQQQPGPSFTFTGELKDHKYIVVMRMPNSREQRVVGEAHGRALAKKGVLDTRWVTSVEIEDGVYGQLFIAAMVFVALTAG